MENGRQSSLDSFDHTDSSQAHAVMQGVKTVMLNNPGTTILILSSATVVAMPALVASPALVAAGFTASGPAAGESETTTVSHLDHTMLTSYNRRLRCGSPGGFDCSTWSLRYMSKCGDGRVWSRHHQRRSSGCRSGNGWIEHSLQLGEIEALKDREGCAQAQYDPRIMMTTSSLRGYF